MDFLPPLADARNYPPINISALPTSKIVRHEREHGRKLPQNAICLDILDHARTALYIVAKTVKAQHVWIPSYHCPALVEPFLSVGKTVSFYPIHADLTPDFAFLEAKIGAEDLLIGIRYFGFDCQIQKLALLCQQYKVELVEDLAHAAFIERMYAKVAVTSLIKFYPVSQGGELLLSNTSNMLTPLTQALKKLPSYRVVKIKQFIEKILNKFRSKPAKAYRYFIKKNCCNKIDLSDLGVIDSNNQSEIMSTRKKNYRYLVEKLKTSAWGHVLIPELPEKVTPYVVPFLLNNRKGFDHIRQQGIQIYRWEEMVDTGCNVSKEYREKLVQLPCHQDLSLQQLDFIVQTLMENNNEHS